MTIDDLHDATLVFRPRKRKLSIEQVVEAMELRSNGLGYERLGMIFGVSQDCMRNNIQGAQRHGYNWWRL
jgi:hypothetical protein